MTTPTPAIPGDDHPAPSAPGPDTADVDQMLADRCTTNGEWLAGIIAAAQLDTAGRPTKLPADLYPHLPATDVDVIWARALAVGYRAGHLAAAPRYNRDLIDRLQAELAVAGYTAMARQILRTTRTHTTTAPSHPADDEQHRARGGHE
ncbi:hypothetical protein ACFQ0X_44085 [Streptomyces rectiviolaceus]|uniref:Uncharacterized protein n=1 Tax=Streptomyces rectiviolaceus TaxID=332591 RepID=A0ABP6NQC4_9ACTN